MLQAGDTFPPGARSTLRCILSTNPHVTQQAPLRDIYYLNNILFFFYITSANKLHKNSKSRHLWAF